MDVIRYERVDRLVTGYYIPEKDLVLEDFPSGISKDRPFAISDPEHREEIRCAYKGKKIGNGLKYEFTKLDYDEGKINEFIENISLRDKLEKKVAQAFYDIKSKFNSESKSNQKKIIS